jgi:hypothetical protein
MSKLFSVWGRLHVAKRIPVEYASTIGERYFIPFVLDQHKELGYELCVILSRDGAQNDYVIRAKNMFHTLGIVPEDQSISYMKQLSTRYTTKKNLFNTHLLGLFSDIQIK